MWKVSLRQQGNLPQLRLAAAHRNEPTHSCSWRDIRMVQIGEESASYCRAQALEWVIAMLPPARTAISAVATRIQAEVHCCPKCGVNVVTMRDSGNADASAECRCRHNHSFVPSNSTLAPKIKDSTPQTPLSHAASEPPKKKSRK